MCSMQCVKVYVFFISPGIWSLIFCARKVKTRLNLNLLVKLLETNMYVVLCTCVSTWCICCTEYDSVVMGN